MKQVILTMTTRNFIEQFHLRDGDILLGIFVDSFMTQRGYLLVRTRIAKSRKELRSFYQSCEHESQL